MAVVNATQNSKSVADPIATYMSMRPIWGRNRAALSGDRFVKDYDGLIDVVSFSNLLIPFSPSMSQTQYDFYKAEAEFPGIISQYARMLIGGLLRKQPTLKLPKDAPEEAYQWILRGFGQDSSPITSFLNNALWEELNTSHAWVYIDYPTISEKRKKELLTEDFLKIRPYPVLWGAESVINWSLASSEDGCQELIRVIVRNYEEDYSRNEFHCDYIDTVWVHELDTDGYYQIRKYQKPVQDSSIAVVSGRIQQNYDVGAGSGTANSANDTNSVFSLVETIIDIESHGERLRMIPAWPLSGNYDIVEPVLSALVDREIALYNKISRRNHLLYGAATYTPVVSSNMSDEEFESVVEGGLGSWIHLQQGDTATVLPTPNDALADMDRAIASSMAEMAKMGLRMLTPEVAQSGVALDIRNAAQSAQLGSMNTCISNQMTDIIAHMLNRRYGTKYTSQDVKFEMSSDFNPTPVGEVWLRLVTEWYETGKIPRSIWLQIAKQNDIIPPDYDDLLGQEEVNNSDLQTIVKQDNLKEAAIALAEEGDA